jgi:hypothetical protein
MSSQLNICSTSGSRNSDYEDFCPLGHNAVQPIESQAELCLLRHAVSCLAYSSTLKMEATYSS